MPRTGSFKRLEDIFISAAASFKKADRLSVTQVAEEYVIIRKLGARTGKWSSELTPYMVEPQDSLTSRLLSSTVFVGPSQSGKTEALILNWIAYSVIQDPMDMILFSPTQQNSRDFSVRRVDRLNLFSPAMKSRLVRARSTDNKQAKQYSSGMILNLSWPTVSEMAGKPVGRVAITDYDRIDDDIGGEGSAFDLASMRTTTYGSFAMTCAESSPSRPITNSQWMPSTPHEAPPATGILSLYNRGDRRRWYWPCYRCGEYFEGNFKHLVWEIKENVLDSADTVKMQCPICGMKIGFHERPSMNDDGVWLKDGQKIENGRIVGRGERSKMASFWLNGVAAAFQSWPEIVAKFLNATREFETTGNESGLQQFYNNVLGEPYKPKSQELERLPEVLQDRAEDFGGSEENPVVPDGVRLIVATVDVQRRCFVVQVHGISLGAPYDIVVLDRFRIEKSDRRDQDGDRLGVRPGAYQEDWELLIEEVMLKTYPMGNGWSMMVKLTVCDSGGEDGVTTNAYDFYRSLKKKGLANRFQLVKGNPNPNSPRSYIDFPDQKRKDKMAIARGDVPVLFLNSNVWKDTLSNRLDSTVAGKGLIRFPWWLKPWFYKELCAEQRTEKGWISTQRVRNEAWDLLYYCLGACASPLLRVDAIDWSSPPIWAEEPKKNPMVISDDIPKTLLTEKRPAGIDFASLGKELA